jgi:cytochrome d ubiquinol oxidase subunit II
VDHARSQRPHDELTRVSPARSSISAFFLGSLIGAFVQGAAIGAMVEERPVDGGQFAGGPFVWLTPFAIWCGLGLVVGYTLLGATWLILKTEGELREWAYRRVPWLLGAVLVFLLVGFIFAVAEQLRVIDRWLDRPALLIFPVIGGLATLGLYWRLRRRRDGRPFVMTVVIFAAAFGAMAGSFWPYMIPFAVTIEGAASPTSSLRFRFWGAGLFALPVIIVYTACVCWIFRGKVRAEALYD